MIICKKCGVELEPDMQFCPLCSLPVAGFSQPSKSTEGEEKRVSDTTRNMTQPQRKATWEIISIITLLVIMVTCLLNYILNRKISWAEYPIAVSLIIFSYISIFAFLNTRIEIKIGIVFILASFLIGFLDWLTKSHTWSLSLGIPLLFVSNIITIGIIQIFKHARRRGINLIAFLFSGASMLCILAELIVDHYITGQVKLVWSLIVLGCVLPVVTVLLFMHFRLKKGTDLGKTFHI